MTVCNNAELLDVPHLDIIEINTLAASHTSQAGFVVLRAVLGRRRALLPAADILQARWFADAVVASHGAIVMLIFGRWKAWVDSCDTCGGVDECEEGMSLHGDGFYCSTGGSIVGRQRGMAFR